MNTMRGCETPHRLKIGIKPRTQAPMLCLFLALPNLNIIQMNNAQKNPHTNPKCNCAVTNLQEINYFRGEHFQICSQPRWIAYLKVSYQEVSKENVLYLLLWEKCEKEITPLNQLQANTQS